jgi:hypothetical protein
VKNKGKTVWVWDVAGELISCGFCGLTAHADWWQEEELKQAGWFAKKVSVS